MLLCHYGVMVALIHCICALRDMRELGIWRQQQYANLGSRDISKELTYHHHEINQSEHSMLTNESAPLWVGL